MKIQDVKKMTITETLHGIGIAAISGGVVLIQAKDYFTGVCLVVVGFGVLAYRKFVE